MTVFFTEKEKKYIVISKGDWRIKPNCPAELAKTIKKKLDLLRAD